MHSVNLIIFRTVNIKIINIIKQSQKCHLLLFNLNTKTPTVSHRGLTFESSVLKQYLKKQKTRGLRNPQMSPNLIVKKALCEKYCKTGLILSLENKLEFRCFNLIQYGKKSSLWVYLYSVMLSKEEQKRSF